MWPPSRTTEYVIWASCREFGILPPDAKPSWDECDTITQAKLIAFHQTSEHVRIEELKSTAGVR